MLSEIMSNIDVCMPCISSTVELGSRLDSIELRALLHESRVDSDRPAVVLYTADTARNESERLSLLVELFASSISLPHAVFRVESGSVELNPFMFSSITAISPAVVAFIIAELAS
jgi:hypothetical protein